MILQVKLPAVNRIHLQSNKFAMGVLNKVTGDSKLNDSSVKGKGLCKLKCREICRVCSQHEHELKTKDLFLWLTSLRVIMDVIFIPRHAVVLRRHVFSQTLAHSH